MYVEYIHTVTVLEWCVLVVLVIAVQCALCQLSGLTCFSEAGKRTVSIAHKAIDQDARQLS